MSILTYFRLIINALGRVHLPSKPIMLLRGRCTRYFRLIINVLYTKRGKSVPPSIKTFAKKKCTCNPNIAKSAFAFLELNAKHVQVDNNALKKKNFYITRQLVTLNAASYCGSYRYSGDSFQNTRHPLITPKCCNLLRM